MQMAMVGAAVANDGVVMKPYVVGEEQAPDLSTLSVTEPEPLSRAVSPGVAQQLNDMMVGVVTDGTGGNAAIPGFTVAGKTGTAQDGTDGTPTYGLCRSPRPRTHRSRWRCSSRTVVD